MATRKCLTNLQKWGRCYPNRQICGKIGQRWHSSFPECGRGKEAVLETVLNKIREQRRQQKDTLPVKKCCQQTVHLSQPSQPSPVVEILFHLLIHISCNVCSKFTTFILMKLWELRKLLPPIIDFHFFSWSWEPKTLLKS